MLTYKPLTTGQFKKELRKYLTNKLKFKKNKLTKKVKKKITITRLYTGGTSTECRGTC
jgi:hypothetical protein